VAALAARLADPRDKTLTVVALFARFERTNASGF